MTKADSQDLGHGITCIDAHYMKPGMACFYLVSAGDEWALVETGTSLSFPYLSEIMANMGVARDKVRFVIPTHVHLDHAGGAGTMMAAFPQAQLLIHPRGARHMADPERLVTSSMQVYGEEAFRKLYGDITPIDAARIVELQDGQRISLGDRELEFRYTRGHADHHLCVWDATSRGWFSGDMFGLSYPWFRFSGGDFLLPTTTPTQFDPEAFLESLELLQSYDPRCMYLTHYGKLEFASSQVELLRAQVLRYCELAERLLPDVSALRAALMDYCLELMAEFQPEEPQLNLRDMLDFDTDLNVQGLQAWRSRLDRASQ